jgi:hypothetical protein
LCKQLTNYVGIADEGEDDGQRFADEGSLTRRLQQHQLRDWYGETNTAESEKSSDDVSYGGLSRDRDTGSVRVFWQHD